MQKSSIDSFFEAKKEFINFASSVARLSTAVYNSRFLLSAPTSGTQHRNNCLPNSSIERSF